MKNQVFINGRVNFLCPPINPLILLCVIQQLNHAGGVLDSIIISDLVNGWGLTLTHKEGEFVEGHYQIRLSVRSAGSLFRILESTSHPDSVGSGYVKKDGKIKNLFGFEIIREHGCPPNKITLN